MRARVIACAALFACGGGGGGGGSSAAPGGGSGAPPPPPVTLPAGGGDWAQYRGSVRGTSSSPGTWDVSDVPAIAPLWTRDLSLFGDTQPIIAGDPST